MAVIFIRTILIYILLLVVMRISGKRQIGEIQISELVTTFLLSDIAAYPLTNPGIPILNAVIPIFTIIPLEIIFSFLSTKCATLKKLLDGNPSIVILHGKIQKKEMEHLRISMDDLLCELRLKSIASVSDVDYAILEQNGQISIFEKNQAPLSHAIIIDGTLNTKLLKQIGKNKHWVLEILKSKNIKDFRDVFLLSVTDDGNITLIKQDQTDERKHLS